MKSSRVVIDIEWKTIFRIFAAFVLVWAALKLRTLFTYLLFALLFSVAMAPMVTWFEKRGLKRGAALGIVLMLIVGILFSLFGIVATSIATTVVDFVQDLPQRLEDLRQYQAFEGTIDQVQEAVSSIDVKTILDSGLQQGGSLLSGASKALEATLFTFFFTVYFLLEREYLLRILHRLLPPVWNKRFPDLSKESVEVIGGYLRGQIITSFLVGVSSYVIFRIFDVPNAGGLAIIAGLTDVIPVVGGLLGIIPAAIMALTINPITALVVVVLMQTYSTFNNYVITPRVYGASLELSPFIVTLATTSGLYLFGIAGILLALPVAALVSYILTKYHNIPIMSPENL